MPDRDIFDRTVRPGWKTAARLVIGSADDPSALASLIRALAKEVKNGGCPGLDQIVDIVVDDLRASDQRAARHLAHWQLDRVRLLQGNGVTEIAIIAAKQFLARPASLSDNSLEKDEEETRINVAAHILADLADALMCSARLRAEIVEQGQVSFQAVQARRDRAKEMLVSAPEIRRLAQQLLADSSGALVKSPRISRAKLSQAEILVTALTE